MSECPKCHGDDFKRKTKQVECAMVTWEECKHCSHRYIVNTIPLPSNDRKREVVEKDGSEEVGKIEL